MNATAYAEDEEPVRLDRGATRRGSAWRRTSAPGSMPGSGKQ
jgi:hypothetical protein